MSLGEVEGRVDWAIVLRFAVWCLFMVSGVVVIPISIVTLFGIAPIGVVIFLTWLEWAEGFHTWMLGRTSFLGEPIKTPVCLAESESAEVVKQQVPEVCPACGYKCLSGSGTPTQCSNCTYLFGIERKTPSIVARASIM